MRQEATKLINETTDYVVHEPTSTDTVLIFKRRNFDEAAVALTLSGVRDLEHLKYRISRAAETLDKGIEYDEVRLITDFNEPKP